MQVLRPMFPDTHTSFFMDITCPGRLPNLAVQDYFLWGYIKSRVYETCPANIYDLKQQILKCMQGIPQKLL